MWGSAAHSTVTMGRGSRCRRPTRRRCGRVDDTQMRSVQKVRWIRDAHMPSPPHLWNPPGPPAHPLFTRQDDCRARHGATRDAVRCGATQWRCGVRCRTCEPRHVCRSTLQQQVSRRPNGGPRGPGRRSKHGPAVVMSRVVRLAAIAVVLLLRMSLLWMPLLERLSVGAAVVSVVSRRAPH